jgi:dihydrofolate reductase
MAETDANLFGRKTYQKMAEHWPNAPADDPFAKHLYSTQKYVASRTMQEAEWEPTTILRDLADVTALKKQPGGTIAVLGSGKRLFAGNGQVRQLRLVDSQTTGTGGVILTYHPAR